jgi:P pilus assembly chaperone PapD
MPFLNNRIVSGAIAAALVACSPSVAQAGVGDLLVAPTRLVLNGSKGTEVVLNNIGEEPATYRISVEFRRMTPEGNLVEVTDPTPQEKAAADMIIYAPRRVTLPPHQPQAIRIAARPPAGLPDGEYRVHLLFRAVPPPTPVSQTSTDQEKGLRLQLIPVYGVTIPVIVRLGNLQAKSSIGSVKLEKANGKPAVGLDLARTGNRSTFGEVRVMKAGVKNPIALQRGLAVYTEVGDRHVSIPINPDYKGDVSGPVTVQYYETDASGSQKAAEIQAVLR